MKYLSSICSGLCFLVSTIAHGTDYYYCDCQAGASSQCISGSDTNSGTTTNTPRQTFANASSRFGSLNGGDSIRFCRGGSFTINSSSAWVNNNSTSTSIVTVSDYLPSGQSAEPRPMITQTSDNRLFSLADSGNADHEEGYLFSNLDLRCTGCTAFGGGDGFFFYNDVDHVVLNNISFTGFDLGVDLNSSNATNAGSDGTQDNIIIQNINFIDNLRSGLFGGANNLLIENSYFEHNGRGAVLEHNIYINRGTGLIIRNNEFYRSSINTSGLCNGTSFVAHGVLDNVLVEGNTIREDIGQVTAACWGLSFTVGYTNAEGFTNLTIRGNKIINVGNMALGITSCQNCIIENNIILHEQAGRLTAINVPDKGRAANDLAIDNISVRNNSIYITSNASGSIGIRLGSEGTQHEIISNAIQYTGTGDFNCLDASLPASAYTAIDNNICYFPNASATSEWNNGSGNQAPLGANSRNINPGFTNPSLPQADFSPQNVTSGVVSSGHSTLSSPIDFRGKTRDGQPDAGAFEFGTFNPPAKTNLYLN